MVRIPVSGVQGLETKFRFQVAPFRMGFLGALGSGTVYSLKSTCAAAAAVGVLSHVLYFIRGFREREGLAIICVHLAAGTAVYLKSAQTYGIVSGVAFACLVNFSYLCALSSSIIIYRLFFHRLRHFPGPIAAKITEFYGPYRARNWKIHIEDTKLLEKYGDFVRVGTSAGHEFIYLGDCKTRALSIY